MPNINASLILSAIEGDEAVDITPVGSSVVDEPVVPGVTPSDQPAVINDADRNALFLMCMQTANPQGFQSFVKEHAIDMEVQGLIPSAEGLTAAVDSMKGGTHQVVHMAAALLAKNGDSSLYDAYTAAVNAEESAVGAIMQTYGDAATTLVQDVISEYIAKSNSMQTIAGDGIRSMLDQARTSLPVNMAVENDLQFINTELEFCMETERMCEAFESELNDNFYEYAAYALEAEEGKSGFGQKAKKLAHGAWEKIKSFFRRIRDAIHRFITFIKAKASQIVDRLRKKKDGVPVTRTKQKMFKASDRLGAPAAKFFRKSKESAQVIKKAGDLAKDARATDEQMNEVTQTIIENRKHLDEIIKDTEQCVQDIETLRQHLKEDTTIIGKGKPNAAVVEATLKEAQTVSEMYDKATAPFNTSAQQSEDSASAARQKMCFAAASLANTVSVEKTKLVKAAIDVSNACSEGASSDTDQSSTENKKLSYVHEKLESGEFPSEYSGFDMKPIFDGPIAFYLERIHDGEKVTGDPRSFYSITKTLMDEYHDNDRIKYASAVVEYMKKYLNIQPYQFITNKNSTNHVEEFIGDVKEYRRAMASGDKARIQKRFDQELLSSGSVYFHPDFFRGAMEYAKKLGVEF